MDTDKHHPLPGPYTPTLIIHGGAGDITRKNLPPDLYKRYEASLLHYLDSARHALWSGSSALDAAVHAVSLMEDDPLFNCGRGSVFTEKGGIEMEASVMVASISRDRPHDDVSRAADAKRGAGVMLVRNTRHPIQLAREVLLVKPDARASSMHCQLSGSEVEEWGCKERGLERMEDDWFWTKKRWEEHRRGRQKHQARHAHHFDSVPTLAESQSTQSPTQARTEDSGEKDEAEDGILPSQGTVGAVCMDSWGDVAAATSTGGLTNKKAGRIGDTPTLGAGFWAERWEEEMGPRSRIAVPPPSPKASAYSKVLTLARPLAQALDSGLQNWLYPYLSTAGHSRCEDERPLLLGEPVPLRKVEVVGQSMTIEQPSRMPSATMNTPRNPTSLDRGLRSRSRVMAISGTGNGDTFLRTAACRTTAAIARFSNHNTPSDPVTLANAVRMMAGPDGEMQRSAGGRWKVTGDGQAGMIGIELCCELTPDAQNGGCHTLATTVSDFNCGGLFRAFIDEKSGRGKVMVFREAYPG